MKFIKHIIIFIFIFSSCHDNEVANIELDFYRFDEFFSSINEDNFEDKMSEIELSFPNYIKFYLSNNLELSFDDSIEMKSQIINFISHLDVREFNNSINNYFSDIEDIVMDIRENFGKLSYLLPEILLPKKIIFINSFESYGIDRYEDCLVIGLDYYLSKNHPRSDQIEDYILYRYDKRYIVADALEYWISSFYYTKNKTTFLDQLIYNGKIMYLMYEILEDLGVVFRYTDEHVEWCEKYENAIWNEVIHSGWLYKENNHELRSFFYNERHTYGMPEESPTRIGNWIGFQIIRNYIKNSNTNFIQLMGESDYQKILFESKYIP